MKFTRTITCILSASFPISLAIATSASAQVPAATEPAPAAAAAADTKQVEQPAAALPTAEEILAKSVEAIGGREAWLKISSMEIKGAMELQGMNIKGTMHSFSLAPNKLASVMELAGFGKIRTGFDGTTAWAIDPSTGPRILEGGERDMLARESSMHRDLDPAKQWDSVTTVGDGEFGGFSCWKLAAKRGDEVATLWFEKETGLSRGNEMVVETQLGKIPVVNTIAEYRAFGDLKVGSRTITTQMGQKMVATIDSVTFNTVDPAALDLPVEIKALLEPEPTEEDSSAPAAPADAPSAPKQDVPAGAPSAPAVPAGGKAGA